MKPVTILFLTFLLLSFISGIYFCATHNPYTIENMEPTETTMQPTQMDPAQMDPAQMDPAQMDPAQMDPAQMDPGTQPTLEPTIEEGPTVVSCPDLLIKSGNAILLYNSKMPEKPGVNPLPFYNLDEYINYLEIQKRKGLNCPVLFLQEETNTQGQSVFRSRPDVFNQQGGLPTGNQSFNTFTPPTDIMPIPIVEANQDVPPWNSNQYNAFDPIGLHVGQYTTLDAIHDSTFKGKSLSDNPMDDNWGGVLYTKDAVDSGKFKDREVLPPSASGPFLEKSDNINHQKFNEQTSIFA